MYYNSGNANSSEVYRSLKFWPGMLKQVELAAKYAQLYEAWPSYVSFKQSDSLNQQSMAKKCPWHATSTVLGAFF